jgi:hypothetical protein
MIVGDKVELINYSNTSGEIVEIIGITSNQHKVLKEDGSTSWHFEHELRIKE